MSVAPSRPVVTVLEGPPLAMVPDPVRTVVTGPAPVFHLQGGTFSYVVAVTPYGHLEQVHFGAPLGDVASVHDLDPIRVRLPSDVGGLRYAPTDPGYCLDFVPLDWSGLGKGDLRTPAAELRMPDGTFVTDFTYLRHRVDEGSLPHADGQPTAHAAAATLVITLADAGLELDLHYAVFPDAGCLTRRSVLRHTDPDAAPVVIRSLASSQVDLPDRGFDLVTFDGTALREATRHSRPLAPGRYTTASHAGFSGNQHQPGILLATRGATETRGEVWGFNLIYSGNHHTSVELNHRALVRVQSGINPVGFEWTLHPGAEFETPEAVLAYSGEGSSGLSAHFHAFVTDHVVPPAWARRDRPVVFNTWEAVWLDVSHRRVVRLARSARALGAELFLLDDGWFGARDTDRAGLGDWTPHPRKLPRGLGPLVDEIRALGMEVGIWVEPEMVNHDSDLYRAHPDWVIAVPGRTPSETRNQYVLDLTRSEVRDHVVAAVTAVLDSAPFVAVKWDANRMLSDLWSPSCPGGEVGHRYVLGLYDVLRRIFGPRPDLLLETCSSGGARFDLGLLAFGPQAWASDNTDPVSRLEIQWGLSHLYPQSTMGAHVPADTSPYTLRTSWVATRFTISAFGALGLELDPDRASPTDRAEFADQVAFYKRYRRVLQFGRLRRHDPTRPHVVTLSVSDEATDTHVVGQFRRGWVVGDPPDDLPLPPLAPDRRYRVWGRPQPIGLTVLGRLVELLAPRLARLGLRSDRAPLSVVARHSRIPPVVERHEGTGAVLAALRLAPNYEGRGYDPGVRVLGDFGSQLYVVEPVDAPPPPGTRRARGVHDIPRGMLSARPDAD